MGENVNGQKIEETMKDYVERLEADTEQLSKQGCRVVISEALEKLLMDISDFRLSKFYSAKLFEEEANIASSKAYSASYYDCTRYEVIMAVNVLITKMKSNDEAELIRQEMIAKAKAYSDKFKNKEDFWYWIYEKMSKE